jgi:cytochrome c oxidase subunit 2
VHDFNFSRYALPGVTNEFTFYADKTGEHFGQCTQLCGLYHGLMFFRVKVVSQSQYAAWIATFNNPADAAAAKAAAKTTYQQTSAIVPAKGSTTKFGR